MVKLKYNEMSKGPFALGQKFSQAPECTTTNTCSTDSLKLVVTIYLTDQKGKIIRRKCMKKVRKS